MTSKNDYAVIALVGFLAGVFAVPTAVNIGFKNWVILMSLPILLPWVFVAGFWFAGFLARWLPWFVQFAKFAATGFLNMTIDFGILNILSVITGVTSGFVVGGVNIPGFSVAVTNSYFWNKFWVFKNKEGGLMDDFLKFILVSIAGLFLNSAVVIVVTTFTQPFFGASDQVWLNAAKILATFLSLVWNFLGYKFIVFR